MTADSDVDRLQSTDFKSSQVRAESREPFSSLLEDILCLSVSEVQGVRHGWSAES